ncbi:MAG TPA: hypothetical protein DDW86_06400 [Clostridiales bacterium]|jgi:ABC-type antimicrobial peptide transport system permease subunit|nr:hypothetical protein [Clostridiales bacterium]
MKRLKKGKGINWMVAFAYFLAGITVLLAERFIFEYNQYEKISNQYISENARFLQIGDGGNRTLRDLKIHLKKDEVLYQEAGAHAKKVYISEGRFTIPILKGKTFQQKDILSKYNKALVGKNVEVQKDSSGKTIYLSENRKYEVIGVIGIKKPSKLDYMKYLNYGTGKEEPLEGVWILDGKDTTKSFQRMEVKLRENNVKYRELDRESAGIDRVFRLNDKMKIVNGMMILMILFTVLSLTYYWILHKRKEIAILKLCGVSMQRTLLFVLLQYFVYALIGFLPGVIPSFFFAGFGDPGLKAQNTTQLLLHLTLGAAAVLIFVLTYSGKCVDDALRQEA